jgi:peptidyl-prolyl cis-trans isomerase C
MMKIKGVAAILMMAAVLMGCNKSADVIATINGHDVTQSEFNAYLKFKRIPEQDKVRVEKALEEYLQRAALTAAIAESEVLDKSLLEAELEEFRRQMFIGRYFEEHLNRSVDDDSVKQYYANNAVQYETQRVHAAHILIRVDPKMSETERQAKLTSAHDAYSRLQKGDDFSEVAKALSEDTVSAEKGGDLGWLQEGAVDAEFSKRLFALKPGELSEPFLTPFGFHIVKLIEGPQLVKRPVEAVEGDIRYQLRNQAKLEETERLLKSVKISRKE